MLNRTNLDMDVLRTFVTGFDLGSFARAADQLGRSQSAISTQLRKLEDQVGQPLVQKSGRGLALTGAGETLLGYAKRILELNDEALGTVRGSEVEGWIRLGLPQDFAETWLPAVLGRFTSAHPRVRFEVQVERSLALMEKTRKGELDLALVWGAGIEGPQEERVAELAMVWIGRPDWPGTRSLGAEPLPLVAFAPPCAFRAAAVAALDDAGIPWRLVFTSPSLSGLWAAAAAGLGITMRTTVSMPKTLCALEPAISGLPALPSIPLVLHRAERVPSAAVARLKAILLDTLRSEVELSAP
jgi:DNA-binding transcriptional LysR family regulator